MTTYNNIMVDVEGLSKYADCPILSIAVIPFNFMEDSTFQELVDRGLYLKINIKDQLNKGLRINKETLDWWKKQDKDAKEVLKPSPHDVLFSDAILSVQEYLKKHGFDPKNGMFYSRGISYDFSTLQYVSREYNVELPWNQWNLNDTKTMIRLLNCSNSANYNLVKYKIPDGEYSPHVSLHDAAKEILVINELLEKNYNIQ